ncbi:uncharacterized protein [Musca autumnalis]|uniref:uncharacterized protein n=1 Tax=Musca autumnalis TaxID=221902 RepID=UPI003CFB0E03
MSASDYVLPTGVANLLLGASSRVADGKGVSEICGASNARGKLKVFLSPHISETLGVCFFLSNTPVDQNWIGVVPLNISTKMVKRKKRSKVTVQGVNNPVPAVSVGEITSHVRSRSSDCDPAVSGVDALAPTAVTATSAENTTRTIVDEPDFQKDNALAKTDTNQSTADRTGVLGGDDLHLKVIGDSLERQSRELLVPTIPPEDMLNNLTLTDDELDITVIPAESTRRSDDDMSTDGDVVEEVGNLGSQPQTGRNQSGPVSAPADTKLQRQIDQIKADDPPTVTDSKSMTIEGESTETTTIATDSESPACVGVSKETSSTDTDAVAISAKEASDTRHYKRAASYLRKFVGRDASSHTRREIMFIKSKLKYIRKFERNYPNAPRCELLVDKIFLPNPASAKDSEETAATSEKVEVKPVASGSKVEPKTVPKPNPSQKGLEKDKGHNPTPNDSRKSSQLEKVTVPNPDPTPTDEGKADEGVQDLHKPIGSNDGWIDWDTIDFGEDEQALADKDCEAGSLFRRPTAFAKEDDDLPDGQHGGLLC